MEVEGGEVEGGLKEKEEEGRKDRRVKCLSRIGQRRETEKGDREGRQRRETEEGDRGGGRKNPGPLHMWWIIIHSSKAWKDFICHPCCCIHMCNSYRTSSHYLHITHSA